MQELNIAEIDAVSGGMSAIEAFIEGAGTGMAVGSFGGLAGAAAGGLIGGVAGVALYYW